MRKIIFFTILFLLISAFKNCAFAQDFSIGIYPPVLKIQAFNPSNVNTSFNIQNYTNEAIELNIQIKTFTQSNRLNGEVELLPEKTTLSPKYDNFLKKIKIIDNGQEISSLTLAPLQQKKLSLAVNLEEELPAEYYFSIVFLSKSRLTDQTTSSAIVGGIGMNVIFTVGEKQKPALIIQDFSSPWFLLSGPVSISLIVENTSANFTETQGVITIKNIFNQTIGTKKLLPVTILANTSRFIPDTDSLSSTQIIWPEIGLLGIYRVDLRLAISKDGPVFERSIYFAGAPLIITVFIGILIFALTFIIINIIQRIKSK